ncbi:MAG: right-handed parallel beta-helix repeat-containing protein [Chloroflexi bacterium]|nr:right-handed parallel beta-helix repeat-containing protein [Chloroflexota bacterium]
MKRSLTLSKILLLLALACVAIAGTPINSLNSPAQLVAKTYYVRADGADAQKCTGLADAAYPGSGANQPCAWDHPFRALPPFGTPRIAGGDTLIIRNGAYRMGYGAPGAGDCDAGGSFDCLMPPLPSGPDAAHPTRILGSNWNTGCSSAPQLWGAERPWYILNLTDSNNIELGCLEITDHSSCVENHSGALACERDNPPYGNWASYGLYAEDSSNIHLFDLNIHGLAAGGVHAGRINNWTVERVRVNGNGFVGWDGDLWDDNGDSNSGALTFRKLTVEWNGCGETYPGQKPTGCWAQSAGGYGDGFATGTSGGNWLFEDSSFRFNTSDGLDLLYISEADSSVTIRRTYFEGNAGNQVKNYRGPFTLENSVVIGNCGFFDSQPFTFNVDNCRALGAAVAVGLTRGGQATVLNNTITSEGDCLVVAECSSGNCNGTENVMLRNNIFQGAADFLQPFEQTCLVYEETFPSDPFDVDYSLINNVKDDACPGAHDLCGLAPGLTSASIDSFNADLVAASPALDVALASACPATDLRSVPRPQGTGCDLGALEYAPRVTLRSVAAEDGWILESSETSATGGTANSSATTFNVGDDASDKQYRAVLSFDTASVPNNAVIVRVTLKIRKQGQVGTNAFSAHGNLFVDIRKGAFLNDATLQIGDFQASAHRNAVAVIANNPLGSWYSVNFSSAGFAFVNKTGLTQLRMRFQRDDNDDSGADYLKFYSGNSSAANTTPTLVIEYYVP